MKKVLFLALLLSGSMTYAQTSTQKTNEEIRKEQKDKQKRDMNTPYMGLEQGIKDNLISGEIPSTFPKFDASTMNKDDYWKLITQWGMDNKSLVKPESLSKLEEAYKKHHAVSSK